MSSTEDSYDLLRQAWAGVAAIKDELGWSHRRSKSVISTANALYAPLYKAYNIVTSLYQYAAWSMYVRIFVWNGRLN